MFITMLGDLTAYVCIVFAYFFFWTIHDDFPPEPSPGPGVLWPAIAAVLLTISWALTILARRWNRDGRTKRFYGASVAAVFTAIAGSAALLAGPWLTRLDPAAHVYAATVWILVAWTVVHVGVGVIMQLYCIARRVAGHMTPRHDIDIANVVLYWHFAELMAMTTIAVIAGFPLVA